MIELKRYEPCDKEAWNKLLTVSRNGTFLFDRDYMDYHSDRFEDCSFLVFRKGKLAALLPGNIGKNVFYSHQGLTYGGVVTTNSITTSCMLSLFDALNGELRSLAVVKVVYKAVPYFYSAIPSQEDIYALFRNNSRISVANPAALIPMRERIPFIELRRRGVRKARKNGISANDAPESLRAFWNVLQSNLEGKYETKPVHSFEEIQLLRNRFPDNIRLHAAVNENGDVVAGVLMFLTPNVAHVQYISASEEGKASGALDFLFDRLINSVYAEKPWFDFGTSTENNGTYLNENLVFQKEGFGGRTAVYEIFEYDL